MENNETIDLKKLGNRYKELRLDKATVSEDFPQTKLARILGITRQEISNIENGKKMPSKKVVEAYHKYFKVSKEYLRGESDVKNYNYLEAGKSLGLSDKVIEEFYNRGERADFVKVLNNIFDIGYGWRLLESLCKYFESRTSVIRIKKCIKIPVRKISGSEDAYIKVGPDIIDDINEVRLHRLLTEIKKHYYDDAFMKMITEYGNED